MIKAVIFDMDGVLIDAKEWHYESLNKALEFYGYKPISRNDHLEKYDGLPTKEKLTLYPETRGLEKDTHNKINNKKQELTTEVISTTCYPNQTHINAIKKLKKEGYKLAVCSNSIRSTIENMLKKSNIIDLFDFYLSCEDVNRPKPHSDIYLKAIKNLKIEPNEVLICEDNMKGIQSGLDSGAYVLEVGTTEDVNIQNIEEAISKVTQDPTNKLIRPSVRTVRLSEMAGGWFVGDFFPNILCSKDFEVAVKTYRKGDKEAWHVHRKGTEITLVLDGSVKMCERTLKHGDVILLEPGNGTSFEALSDVKTVVVKTPSCPDDKFFS